MAGRRCTNCPTILTNGQTRCEPCNKQADKQRRPNGSPYATKGHKQFRQTVLARDPICVICMRNKATIADHYPTERRDLILAAHNPNDPKHGRGLCKPCHDKHTAATSPGGWNKRP